jgi:beta-lactamase regulating signal transducer with metallopeptidase domain
MDVIINWLWQGALIALATTALVAWTRPSARLRYLAWTLALALVLAMPVVSMAGRVPVPGASAIAGASAGAGSSAGSSAGAGASVDASAGALLVIPRGGWLSGAVAIGMWAGWVVVQTGRLAGALVALWQAKRRCLSLPSQREARLTWWVRLRQSGRRTRLAVSNGVQSAAVLGGPSPIVALAPALLDELGDDEIDCVVAHEWAHVQRRDDVAILAQAVVRVIAGWHPAVWWLDRQMTAEREHACDEQVVELTGAAKGYAACLVKLAGLSMQPVRPLPVVAMAAAGLRPRVERILSLRTAVITRPRRGACLAAAAGLSAFAASLSGMQLIEAADPDTRTDQIVERYGELAAPLGVTFRMWTVAAMAPAASVAAQSGSTADARLKSVDAAIATSPVAPAPAAPASDVETPASREPSTPVAAMESLDVTSRPIASIDTSMASLREGLTPAAIAAAPPAAAAAEPTPWGAAADAGVAIGRGSQKAAVATAGFFSRFGKKLASSF